MIETRLRRLVRHIGAARLVRVTAIKERQRWQTVATNQKVKARVEDLEQLIEAFPQYREWLLSGEARAPGQAAPEFDEQGDEQP